RLAAGGVREPRVAHRGSDAHPERLRDRGGLHAAHTQRDRRDARVIDHRQVSDHRAGNGDVGLVVTRRKDDLTVVTSTDGSAARRAGLESGDQIVKIDGVETQTLENSEAVDRLRGRSGTTVTLTVLRQGWAEPRDFTLTRERRDGPMLSSRDIGD